MGRRLARRRSWGTTVLRALAPTAALVLALSGCAIRRAPSAVDWTSGDVVSYRILTKDDFKARTANGTWGNVAHGAEICANILPADDYEATGAFRAVMKQDCSFWNRVVGPLGFLVRMAGYLFGVPTLTPVKQPDWYILQHEQIHFAIVQVAALELSRQLGQIAPERRTLQLTKSVYQLTLSHVNERHVAFDSETSGRYDPQNLEKWVQVLEVQLKQLCGDGASCRVRTATPSTSS